MTKRHYRRRRRNRLRTLFLLFFLIAAGAVFFHWSNHSLQTEEFTFVSDRLPEGFDGCRIVQLSDLHGAEFGKDNEELISAVKAAQPDYIILTGDLLDRFRETPQSYAAALCAALADIAPTYFITGNHEWALRNVPQLKRAISEAGTTVLSNEYVTLERGGDTIVLAGIDDPNGYADQKTPEELAGELYSEHSDPFWLLMAHRNNYFEKEYRFLGADLTFAGHAHGGMIRLPFTDGLISVERTLFPSYTAGFYEIGGARLFVSRGLGNSGPSFRLFNRPQVAIVILKRG